MMKSQGIILGSQCDCRKRIECWRGWWGEGLDLTQVTLLELIFAFFEGEIARKSNGDGAGIVMRRCSEDLVS